MLILTLSVALLALLFGAFLRGAPYVPTHKKQIETALDLLNLPQGSTVVDLGSGDGIFLKAAAERGLKAYGYEINPFLYVISWLRCLKYSGRVKVFWRDYWLTKLPPEVDGIFVFSGGMFMSHLNRWLDSALAGRPKPLLVVSYAFAIPGKKPLKVEEALNLYALQNRQ